MEPRSRRLHLSSLATSISVPSKPSVNHQTEKTKLFDRLTETPVNRSSWFRSTARNLSIESYGSAYGFG
ncbi:unnamed protein product [Prunus armeniaca]